MSLSIPVSLDSLVLRVLRERSRRQNARGSFNFPKRLSLEDSFPKDIH